MKHYNETVVSTDVPSFSCCFSFCCNQLLSSCVDQSCVTVRQDSATSHSIFLTGDYILLSLCSTQTKQASDLESISFLHSVFYKSNCSVFLSALPMIILFKSLSHFMHVLFIGLFFPFLF